MVVIIHFLTMFSHVLFNLWTCIYNINMNNNFKNKTMPTFDTIYYILFTDSGRGESLLLFRSACSKRENPKVNETNSQESDLP